MSIEKNMTIQNQSQWWTRRGLRLVQTISESNTHTSNITVLYYEKNSYPEWIADCYLYNLENRLINMISFKFYYNLNKHVSDLDYLRLHLVSWVIVAIEPLARLNICGTVNLSCHCLTLLRWFDWAVLIPSAYNGSYYPPILMSHVHHFGRKRHIEV
jgi:hypothetical protein